MVDDDEQTAVFRWAIIKIDNPEQGTVGQIESALSVPGLNLELGLPLEPGEVAVVDNAEHTFTTVDWIDIILLPLIVRADVAQAEGVMMGLQNVEALGQGLCVQAGVGFQEQGHVPVVAVC